MKNIDTNKKEELAGAVYFVVGIGTEGGSASYKLSVAGVTKSEWGTVGSVAANSGYSLGAIQIDFGQRGEWPVGGIAERPLQPGEKSYVDAVIEQASDYAAKNKLPFTSNLVQVRDDLLSHGNGKKGRSSIQFIDADTRDSISSWASSEEGKKWIHHNMDLPQARNATNAAISILDKHGDKVLEDRKFEAICLLAKTANQFPSKLPEFTAILKDGGGYDELLSHAQSIQRGKPWFHAEKAAEIADKYEKLYGDDVTSASMDAAHLKVTSADYNPSKVGSDPDITASMLAVGGNIKPSPMADGMLRLGERGHEIAILQEKLVRLGMTDAKGNELSPDESYGPRTKQAVEKFQKQEDLPITGIADALTLKAINRKIDPLHDLREMNERLGALGKAAGGDDDRTPKIIGGMPDYLLPNRGASRSRSGHQEHDQPDAHRPAFADGKFNLGDEGIGVQMLQHRLNEMGYVGRKGQPLVADSDFGQNTKFAVQAFQKEHGLAPTGEVDLAVLRQVEASVAQGYVRAPVNIDPPANADPKIDAAIAVRSEKTDAVRDDAIVSAPAVVKVADAISVPSAIQGVDASSKIDADALSRETAQFHSRIAQDEHPENGLRSTYRDALPLQGDAAPQATSADKAADGPRQVEAPDAMPVLPSRTMSGSRASREEQEPDEPRDTKQAIPDTSSMPLPTEAPQRAIDLLGPKEREKYEQALTQAQRLGLPEDHTENLAMAMTQKATQNPLIRQIDYIVVVRGKADDGGDRVHLMFKPHGDRDPIFNDYVDLNKATTTDARTTGEQVQSIALAREQAQQQQAQEQTQSTGPTMRIGGLTIAKATSDEGSDSVGDGGGGAG
jgi:peptidoglycan hydrolase-like protein with peptidoglycan-binding domain